MALHVFKKQRRARPLADPIRNFVNLQNRINLFTDAQTLAFLFQLPQEGPQVCVRHQRVRACSRRIAWLAAEAMEVSLALLSSCRCGRASGPPERPRTSSTPSCTFSRFSLA